jgi:hypothetical protein
MQNIIDYSISFEEALIHLDKYRNKEKEKYILAIGKKCFEIVSEYVATAILRRKKFLGLNKFVAIVKQ